MTLKDVDSLVGQDCGEDEELFLAVAALRNDTDMYQWFVSDIDNGDWIQSSLPQFNDSWVDDDYEYSGDPFISDQEKEGFAHCPYHKATIEELVKIGVRFKDKNILYNLK